MHSNKELYEEDVKQVKALIVLDTVEWNFKSLDKLENYLNLRPKKFKSEKNAIKWALEKDIVRSIRSAKVSIPHRLISANEKGKEFWEWRTDLMGGRKYWEEWNENFSNEFMNL